MKTILTILLILPLASPARAAKEPPAPPANAATAPVAPEGPVPSREVRENVEGYVALLRGRLAINGRDRGPFGFHQDLSKSKQSLLPIPTRVTERDTVTPFSDVVRAIPIAAVFPLEQEFLVGARVFRTGQTFPLVAEGENIKVRVEAVRSASVQFRNLRSGEVIEKRLDLLPDGVTPGGGSIEVPGMISRKKESEAPLHINLFGK